MNCAEKLLEPTIFFNLYIYIHTYQVTIEFRFRESLAQERFKSILEFKYLIIVSSIKFRKGSLKFIILKALLKKFLS